jgi:hypothetical protein
MNGIENKGENRMPGDPHLVLMDYQDQLAAERKVKLAQTKDAIIRDVADLPDRTSPDDQPEMMMVSGEELQMILDRHLEWAAEN